MGFISLKYLCMIRKAISGVVFTVVLSLSLCTSKSCELVFCPCDVISVKVLVFLRNELMQAYEWHTQLYHVTLSDFDEVFLSAGKLSTKNSFSKIFSKSFT